MAGRLARTRKTGVKDRSPGRRALARPKAARKETVTVIRAAPSADVVLVASSCQNAGSAPPISEKCWSVAGPVHDGGRELLSGRTPRDARPVQRSGTRNAAVIADRSRMRTTVSRLRL